MSKRAKNSFISWDDHLDAKNGKEGTPTRLQFEDGFEAFKIGVLIQEARKLQHLTQDELALRSGSTKSYISRIEKSV